VNGVLLCVTADDEARNVKELIERLYRERIIYREKALAAEKDTI
jgi:D-Tyr-tRNAtyr deacylase